MGQIRSSGPLRSLHWAILTMGLLQVLLSACAPVGGSLEAQRSDLGRGTTGFSDSAGRAYTVGGDPRALAIVAPPSSSGQANLATTNSQAQKNLDAELPKESEATKNDLGSKVLGAQILRYRREGKEKLIDRLGPHWVQVKVELTDGKTLSFEGPLEKQNQAFLALKLEGPQGYQALVDFHDQAKDNESLSYLRLNEVGSNGQILNRAEIFGRSYSAQVRIEPLSGVNPSGFNLLVLKNLRQNTFAWVSNTVVMKGRSFYQVNLLKSPSGSTDEIDQLLQRNIVFAFSGDSLRSSLLSPTSAQPSNVGLFRLTSVDLIGDAEDSPERTFSLALFVRPGNDPLKFTMWILPPGESAAETQPMPSQQFRGISRESFLPINLSDVNSRVFRMVQNFESNFALKGVQDWIAKYANPNSQKSPRVGLMRALNNAEPFREILSTIFSHFDVAPSAALLSIIESPFFTKNDYPIVTAPSSTATGPMQLLSGSAQSLGMKVANNRLGARPPSWDERNFLIPSACGAARHLDRSLQTVAAYDHVIAILAYYMGDTRASNTIAGSLGRDPEASAVDKVLKYRITFRQVSTQHMVEARFIEYVYKVLALYFVTGSPKSYSLGWSNGSLAAAKGKVLPPEKLNDPLCLDAVRPLKKLLTQI